MIEDDEGHKSGSLSHSRSRSKDKSRETIKKRPLTGMPKTYSKIKLERITPYKKGRFENYYFRKTWFITEKLRF